MWDLNITVEIQEKKNGSLCVIILKSIQNRS